MRLDRTCHRDERVLLMPKRVPLRETAPIKLNGAGAGTARVGPLSAREVWYPDNAAVSVDTHVKEAECSVYAGESASQSYFRDKADQGSSGDSTGAISADTLKNGQYIWAVWTGGDANATATLTVTGMKDV